MMNTRKKKILHTMTWLAKGGGVDNNVLQTLLGLRNEFELHLAVGSEIHHNPFEKLEGIRFIVCPSLVRKISPWNDLKALLFFYRLIRREKYDIVHTHETKASFITRIAAWLARTPFIIYGLHGVTFNDPLSPLVRKIYVLIEKFTVGASDFIVSVSQQVMDIYHSERIGKEIPFQIIRSGINMEPFLLLHKKKPEERDTLRKSLGFNEEDVVLVNVGRFSHAKAQRYTIEAFQELSSHYPNLKLLFIGEGELMEECKAQVNSAGLSSRVNFNGYSDSIPDLVHAADINVLTSLREGLPRVVVEACFCKVPTAAFDVEGLKEIITDEQSGFIVPQGNTAALTEKIKLLIEAPELRIKFGKIGFEHVCRYWDANIMVNELRKLYLQPSKRTTTMNETSEKVKTFFHHYASDFDSLYGHTDKRNLLGKWIDKKFRRVMFLRFEETLKHTSSKEIESVLDIGCGPGRYCIEFLKQGKRVFALDLAQGMLNIAREVVKNNPSKNIEFIYADYLTHEFKEKSDAACLMGFFDYIKEPRDVVNKLKLDVRKEFYGSFPKNGGLLAWQRQIRYNLRNCPLYLYSKKDVEKILDDCGLQGKYTIKDLERDWFVCVKF